MILLQPYQTLGCATKELEQALNGTKFYVHTQDPQIVTREKQPQVKVRGVTVDGIDFIVGAKRYKCLDIRRPGYLFYCAAPWREWLDDLSLKDEHMETNGEIFPAITTWRLQKDEYKRVHHTQNALFLINEFDRIEIKEEGSHTIIRPRQTLGRILRNYDWERRIITPDSEQDGILYSSATKHSIVECTKLALELSAKHLNQFR